MGLRTLSDLGDIAGKVVGVRVDFNVPLEKGEITDDGRIHAAIPTLRALADRGARIVAMSHLGRPDGRPDPQFSLAPVVERLSTLWNHRVTGIEAVTGVDVSEAVASLGIGEILVIGNLRFDARETSSAQPEREALARELAQPLDAVVSDGFGVVHRAQASVVELMAERPSAAGLLIEREVAVMGGLAGEPDRPYTVVLGGSKVSDKLGVIGSLLPKVDNVIIGGGMVFTVLKAMGYQVGGSLLEEDYVDTVKDFLQQARSLGVMIHTPTDIVMAERFAADAATEIRQVAELETGRFGGAAIGLDIGPDSAERFAEVVRTSRTVFWNGPMGVFEMEPFSRGTQTLAEALTQCPGLTVVGGGDSAAAVRLLGFEEGQFGHISTGGGASLEFLEGKVLPGLQAVGWERK